MSAPQKEYLDYYNWYCNAFDVDKRLKKLSRKYGPLGETIYRRMLDLIYSNSYYLEADIEDAAMMVVDKIGSKWVSDEKCAEVLVYCSEIGLFEHDLVKSKVWTAVSIQKRYFHTMSQLRRKISVSQKKYLLIDIPFNVPNPDDSSEETNDSSEETNDSSEETEVNTTKRKEKEINDISNYINKLFDLFEDSFARPLTQIEMQMISSYLEHHSPEMIEHALKIAVCNNAISMKYIEAILNNWRTNNIKTIEQASMGNKPRRQRQTRHVFKTSKYITNQDSESETEFTEADRMELLERLKKLEEEDGT